MRPFTQLALLLAATLALVSHYGGIGALADQAQQAAVATNADPSSQVVELTDANFDALVQPDTGKGGDWIIEFYAPWCGHCKTLIPTWNALAAEVTSSDLHVAKLDATVEVAQAKRFDVRAFPTIKLVSQGRVFNYEGPRSQEALSKFARSRGAGQASTEVGAPPGRVALAAEHVLVLAGDVQTILMRKPMAGVSFVLGGLLAGALLSLLVFALCIDKTPQEFVRFTDPATGQTRTVPYVRPPATTLVLVPGAQAVPAAAAAPAAPSQAAPSQPNNVEDEEEEEQEQEKLQRRRY